VKQFDIYIDGAAKGNPGPAGIGVMICHNGEVIKNIAKHIGSATNNVAEYTALIYALKESRVLDASNIKVFTDSELLYKQIRGEYKVRHENLKPLFEQIQDLLKEFSFFEIRHIRRENNRGADKLADQAAKEIKVG